MSAIVLPSGASTPAAQAPGIKVRPRAASDFPALAALLERQQPTSLYPVRWPLPMPVDTFIARPGEVASFVAEGADGALLGHVAVRSGLGGPVDERELTTRWAVAHQCREEDVRVIAVLFTDPMTAGMGVGSALFRAATDAALKDGGRPCLDVVATNTGPVSFYHRRGWKTIGEWGAPWNPDKLTSVLLMILPLDAVENGSASSSAATPAHRGSRMDAVRAGA